MNLKFTSKLQKILWIFLANFSKILPCLSPSPLLITQKPSSPSYIICLINCYPKTRVWITFFYKTRFRVGDFLLHEDCSTYKRSDNFSLAIPLQTSKSQENYQGIEYSKYFIRNFSINQVTLIYAGLEPTAFRSISLNLIFSCWWNLSIVASRHDLCLVIRGFAARISMVCNFWFRRFTVFPWQFSFLNSKKSKFNSYLKMNRLFIKINLIF